VSGCLAIIGTAGRGDDAKALTAAHWRMMTCVAQTVVTVLECDHLVSGGSAWADHVAVQLFLDGAVKRLTLHLPCGWHDYEKHWAFEGNAVGQRLNQLHSAFIGVTGVDSWEQIQRAIQRGAEVRVNRGGFKARNSDVAEQGASLLAFTFSGGPDPADGGTADTWAKFRASVDAMFRQAHEHYQESPCGCSCNIPDPVSAYHFDLLNRRLYRHVFTDPVAAAERDEYARRQEEREEAERVAATPRARTAEEERLDLL
jgi:hypothetical protein